MRKWLAGSAVSFFCLYFSMELYNSIKNLLMDFNEFIPLIPIIFLCVYFVTLVTELILLAISFLAKKEPPSFLIILLLGAVVSIPFLQEPLFLVPIYIGIVSYYFGKKLPVNRLTNLFSSTPLILTFLVMIFIRITS